VKTQHRLRGGKLALEMQVYGGGEPLLFLHGAGGLQEDDPFLTRLGQYFKVYAPHLPGYGKSTGAELIEDVIDAALMYHQLMDELEIASAYILGHSMGGMLACEVAALDIHRARRLMLAAPAGLWLDAAPVTDIFTLDQNELAQVLFHDPDSELAQKWVEIPADPEVATEAYVERVRRLSAAGKFLWPIPDRGLAKRIYRIAAPTLLIWGTSDRVVPPVYADEFRQRIRDARIVSIPAAGHLPMYEQPQTFIRAVTDFCAA
jgi:pimeloyl-ACP methyl ester carboxylesterase